MSKDIAKILKKQRKRKLLGQSDSNTNFLMTSLLQDMLQEEISDYLDKEKNKLAKELETLESGLEVLRGQINRVSQLKQARDGYTPIKGKDYFDGVSADEEKIIKTVLGKIGDVEDGKDADEEYIIKRILNKMKSTEPGKQGKPGKDGSPDTPEQIADKLNTLEERVDMKVIKGLKTYFDNLNKKLQSIKSSKGGGGGMGNVTHQTFSVGSTTTSSSLNSNVAANGNAIWARYQGQMLVKDTHYTVSGSTITWLETFNDNTFVDVTYIRK